MFPRLDRESPLLRNISQLPIVDCEDYMATAEINGTTIYYEEAGAGFPCLLLHGGLGVDSRYLVRTFGPLEDRLRMVFYDHRGNGRSGRPPFETVTIEQLADDAAALAAHLGIGRALAIGHSYGGFVAQELAIRHPALIAALILADTTPGQLGSTESPDDEQGPPMPPVLVRAMEQGPEPGEDMDRFLERMQPYYFEHVGPEVFGPVLEGTVYHGAMMTHSMELLTHWSSVDRLPSIAVPVLAVTGRHDFLCSPPQATRITSKVPHGEAAIIEGCGHFPFIEAPAPFFAAVESWLSRVSLA